MVEKWRTVVDEGSGRQGGRELEEGEGGERQRREVVEGGVSVGGCRHQQGIHQYAKFPWQGARLPPFLLLHSQSTRPKFPLHEKLKKTRECRDASFIASLFYACTFFPTKQK